MTKLPSLLPGNAGPFMRAISRSNLDELGETFDLAGKIRTLWSPEDCPASELTLLAWAWSVDFLDPAWPEARKRRVIAESRLYHSRKTSVAGIRMALGYRDASLVRAYLPRHGFFVDRAPDPAEEAAWRRGLPELRVYDAGPVVLARPIAGYLGRNFFVAGDARLSRRATLVRDGIETDVRVIPGTDPAVPGDRFVLPIDDLRCLVVGRPGRMFLAPSVLPVKTLAVSYGKAGDEFTRPMATLGDQGAFIEARRRKLTGAFPPMTGVGGAGLFVVAPTTVVEGYLSLRFSDEPGRRSLRAPSNVVGRSRVQRAPFTANYLVKWQVEAPRSALPMGRRVAAGSEPLVLGFMEAIAGAQALRDVSSISLTATRRLTYSDVRQIKAGTRYGNRRDN